MLSRKFESYLIHGQLYLHEVDYIVFDESHTIFAESPFVELMNKSYFNYNNENKKIEIG
jgi:hypothetical protein